MLAVGFRAGSIASVTKCKLVLTEMQLHDGAWSGLFCLHTYMEPSVDTVCSLCMVVDEKVARLTHVTRMVISWVITW